MLTITNNQGRNFNVVVLLKGDRYGLNDCLTWDKEGAGVEFYDATYADQGGFGPEGQFTGGRYFLTTLSGEDGWSDPPERCNGLMLHGGVPEWTISRDNLIAAVAYAKGVAEERK